MPRHHRSHSAEFKRQVVAEHHPGETLHALSRRHDLSRNLIRIRVERAEAGALDEDGAAAERLATDEARIAALERLVGRQALAIDVRKGGRALGTPEEKRAYIRDQRPRGLSVQRGWAPMGIARSSDDAEPARKPRDEAIVAAIRAVTDAFEGYGYRRVGAALRHHGTVVDAKKVRRLMKAHDLNPWRRRRFVRTTDSDHDSPIFPFVAKDVEVHGPDQLWVADLTYVAIAAGFA